MKKDGNQESKSCFLHNKCKIKDYTLIITGPTLGKPTYQTEIFKKYLTEDSVLDRSFGKMVKANQGSSKITEKFIETYPEKREEIYLTIETLK